eukprot:1185647-Prorocentrum_minimum.AAC.7
MVEERETRQREVMVIMGLSEGALRASWGLTYALVFTVVAAEIVAVVHTSFFPCSSVSLLFTFYWIFMLSQISFGFLVASFFTRAKLAAIVGPFMQFAAVMPRSERTSERTSEKKDLPGGSRATARGLGTRLAAHGGPTDGTWAPRGGRGP